MFRISLDQDSTGVTMRFEGKVDGRCALEATDFVAQQKLPPDFLVDLSNVTFADSSGEEVLKLLNSRGGRFIADSAYALFLCDRLQLSRSDPSPTARPMVVSEA